MLFGLGSITSTIDDVEIMFGKPRHFFDKLLGLNGGEIQSYEADIVSEFIDVIVTNRQNKVVFGK